VIKAFGNIGLAASNSEIATTTSGTPGRLITSIDRADTRRIDPKRCREPGNAELPRIWRPGDSPAFARTHQKIPFFRPAADMAEVLLALSGLAIGKVVK
jgi:hypothetical protein